MNTYYVKMFDINWEEYDSYGDRCYLCDYVVKTTKTDDIAKRYWNEDMEKIILKTFNKRRKAEGEMPYTKNEVHFEWAELDNIDVIDLTERNKNE